MERTPSHILRAVALDNLQAVQAGEVRDGVPHEVAEDIGYDSPDTVTQRIASIERTQESEAETPTTPTYRLEDPELDAEFQRMLAAKKVAAGAGRTATHSARRARRGGPTSEQQNLNALAWDRANHHKRYS